VWDSVLFVHDQHDPIVWEGDPPGKVVVMNAGPAAIELRSWFDRTRWNGSVDASIQLRAGDTGATSGTLIRLRILFPGPPTPPPLGQVPFAAVGVKYLP
jgi:hypothetical protein